MTDIQRYDNLVLGSGEAGKYLAWTLAKAGQRSAVVEHGLGLRRKRDNEPAVRYHSYTHID